MAVRAYVSQVLLWFIPTWHKGRGIQAIDETMLPRLQKALAYIEEHLDEPMTARDVCGALSMGLSTFSRFFSAAVGMSLPAYVRLRRLGRAALLLTQSSRSITDIALDTGFSSASHLIACFKKQYNATPSHFRKLYASNAQDPAGGT